MGIEKLITFKTICICGSYLKFTDCIDTSKGNLHVHIVFGLFEVVNEGYYLVLMTYILNKTSLLQGEI